MPQSPSYTNVGRVSDIRRGEMPIDRQPVCTYYCDGQSLRKKVAPADRAAMAEFSLRKISRSAMTITDGGPCRSDRLSRIQGRRVDLSGVPTSAQRALDGARSLSVGWNAKRIVGKTNESVSRVGVATYG
jgi:hypothetical protein